MSLNCIYRLILFPSSSLWVLVAEVIKTYKSLFPVVKLPKHTHILHNCDLANAGIAPATLITI